MTHPSQEKEFRKNKVKLVQTVRQDKGGRWEYPSLVIYWPEGLSLPRPGEFVSLSEADEFTVRQVDYTPLDETVATIAAEDALAEAPQTAAEWCAENRPGWSLR